MQIAKRYGVGLALYGATLIGCASNQLSTGLQSYLDTKENLLTSLETGSRLVGSGANYRLVAIPPLIEPYRPGTPLRRGSAEPLTDACLVPPSDLPESTEVSEPPDFSYGSSFQLGVSMPEILSIVSKEVADLRATIVANSSATLRFSDLRQHNVRTDTLKIAALNDKCMNAIAGIDVLMIRGLIYATEAISNRHAFGADVKVKFIRDETLSIRYDSSGGYEVKETKPKPKFWIVSEWRVDIPGLQQPASPAARREVIAAYLKENIDGLQLSENPPTKESVKEYVDTLAPRVPAGLRILSITPN